MNRCNSPQFCNRIKPCEPKPKCEKICKPKCNIKYKPKPKHVCPQRPLKNIKLAEVRCEDCHETLANCTCDQCHFHHKCVCGKNKFH